MFKILIEVIDGCLDIEEKYLLKKMMNSNGVE